MRNQCLTYKQLDIWWGMGKTLPSPCGELLSYSATHQARLVRERSISSVELVQAHLEQIARVNPRIHAVIEVFAAQ